MRCEELRRDNVLHALRLRREVRCEARELQVRKRQRVQRMDARGTRSGDRDRERRCVQNDETEAADRHGDARDALRAQRDEAELAPNQSR